jgi:hypothetical protein
VQPTISALTCAITRWDSEGAMLEGCPGCRKNVTGPERGRSRGGVVERVLAKIYEVEMDQDVEPDSFAPMYCRRWGTDTPCEQDSVSGAGRRHPTTPSRNARPKDQRMNSG